MFAGALHMLWKARRYHEPLMYGSVREAFCTLKEHSAISYDDLARWVGCSVTALKAIEKTGKVTSRGMLLGLRDTAYDFSFPVMAEFFQTIQNGLKHKRKPNMQDAFPEGLTKGLQQRRG